MLLVFRSADGYPERLPVLAGELVNLPVDLIVAGATQASLAAKGATSHIPIVSVYTFDPVEAGLVASLARPGGNVTGISAMAREYVGKMLQVLRESAPRADRIACCASDGRMVYWTTRNDADQTPGLASI